LAVTGRKSIEAGSTNSKARSQCVPERGYRVARAGVQTLHGGFAREHFVQVRQRRLTVMRSTNEIRFDTIFALTISRYSFWRCPEIGLDSMTDIKRHKTPDQVGREISIQHLEDSADV